MIICMSFLFYADDYAGSINVVPLYGWKTLFCYFIAPQLKSVLPLMFMVSVKILIVINISDFYINQPPI